MKQIFAVGFGLIAAFVLTVSTAFAGDVHIKEVLNEGSFTGASGHATSGDVRVVTTKDGRTVVLLSDNFSFDGAPDPQISFGKGGKHDVSTLMGKLVSNNGKQHYEVPAGVNVADYTDVFVYCVKFNVPLGVASF
ncbi:MAG: DM13 domain-containing protein [Ascidiaceihabitans sp.]|nr:DM13 domain-containing protein [Ascidiaceihabitans sp.]